MCVRTFEVLNRGKELLRNSGRYPMNNSADSIKNISANFALLKKLISMSKILIKSEYVSNCTAYVVGHRHRLFFLLLSLLGVPSFLPLLEVRS